MTTPRYIKARASGQRRFAFMTSNGGLTHLRVHASPLRDDVNADELLARLRADNPGWEFKVTS